MKMSYCPTCKTFWIQRKVRVWICASCLNDPPSEDATDTEFRKWYQLRKHCHFCGSPMQKSALYPYTNTAGSHEKIKRMYQLNRKKRSWLKHG